MLALGIAFAFVGNVVIGLGNVLQKYALARAAKPPDRPGLQLPKSATQDGRLNFLQTAKLVFVSCLDSLLHSGYTGDPTKPYSRFRDRLWWIGFLATYAGEAGGNWVALSVASPSVVTPLGIVGVIANILFANLLLGEQINKRHRIGYGWIVGGVFFLLWASLTSDNDTMSFEDIMEVEGLRGLTQFIGSTQVLAVTAAVVIAITILINYMRNLYSQNDNALKAKKRRSIIVSSIDEDQPEVSIGSQSNPAASRRLHGGDTDRGGKSISYQASIPSHEQVSSILGIHVLLCSLLGGATVVVSKIVVTFIRCWLADETESTTSALSLLLFLICLLIGTIIAQETVKQLTLQKFSLAVFQPLFYALYVTNVTLLSLAIFEMQTYKMWNLSRVALGILLIAKGVSTILEQDSFGILKRIMYTVRSGYKAVTSVSLFQRLLSGRIIHHHEEAHSSNDSIELK
ncbi:unnamed protein product [Umbelopsis vinacea]